LHRASCVHTENRKKLREGTENLQLPELRRFSLTMESVLERTCLLWVYFIFSSPKRLSSALAAPDAFSKPRWLWISPAQVPGWPQHFDYWKVAQSRDPRLTLGLNSSSPSKCVSLSLQSACQTDNSRMNLCNRSEKFVFSK